MSRSIMSRRKNTRPKKSDTKLVQGKNVTKSRERKDTKQPKKKEKKAASPADTKTKSSDERSRKSLIKPVVTPTNVMPTKTIKKAEKKPEIEATKNYFKSVVLSKKSVKPPVVALKSHYDVMPEKPKRIRERKGKRAVKEPTPLHSFSQEISAIADDFSNIGNNENDGQLFDEMGNPFWTKVLFDPEECEKEGIEMEGRLTSEHVLQYLEGILVLVPPPQERPLMDNTEKLEKLKERDDVYFYEDAIVLHTLKNIIDSRDVVQRCMSADSAEKPKPKPSNVSQMANVDAVSSVYVTSDPVRFRLKNTKNYTYDRKNPMHTIRLKRTSITSEELTTTKNTVDEDVTRNRRNYTKTS